MKNMMNHERKMLDGNGAAAEAIKAVNPSVVAMYPITPQSPLAEKVSAMMDKGELDAKCVCVESEHSAMSYVIGAQLTGVRSTTATSSVGLALMHEVLGVAAGCRVPIVMPVVNRALVAPWSLWCDHQDTMAERDDGWIQLYAENAQEVFDLIVASYRIAENKEVLLPTMVCMDGFYVSHAVQTVLVPDDDAVKQFVGKYNPCNLHLDVNKPMFINNLTSSAEFTEMRLQQERAFKNCKSVMGEVFEEFSQNFGRDYGMLSSYLCDDADVVIVGLGSMCGTIKHVVNLMRNEGVKVGAIKITSFRPFPSEKLAECIGKFQKIAVIDRSAGLGASMGPLAQEVTSSLQGCGCEVFSYIAGLGGRDITEETIRKVVEDALNGSFTEKQWPDQKGDVLFLRKVNS